MTSETHTQRAHARLAPSSAHRWMVCPGSIRMQEGLPDSRSTFAAEGTAAHELAAKCLETNTDPAVFAGQYVDILTSAIVETPEDTDEEDRFFEITEEMVDAVSMYKTHIDELLASDDKTGLSVEQRLDMTHIHPEIYGTGDAAVYCFGSKHLHIVDLKYGKGVAVDADNNPQLLLYAAGTARRYHNMQIEKLTMHIVQPRAQHAHGPVRSYEIDLLELFEFENELAVKAQAAMAPDAPVTAGEHCQFCKAQPICEANRKLALEAVSADFGTVDDETTLPAIDAVTPDQMGRILREADMVMSRVKAVQELAHKMAMDGNTPSGFKLVAKRANRKWIDETLAKEAMQVNGVDESDMYEEPKFRSPAKMERYFPGKNSKERQAAMAELVEKKSSGTNLVPSDDPRPAVHVGPGADFEAVE
ncbi:DUF2800 domain-containing protein [Brucella anthropi]|uniref:DUF2800 domain-containing protein n=1 Tax=Brucella anthropi TaxID=529 RepID=UPI001CFD0C4F|nr:DUF2800 domain-containing protein [Brucella anthropi]